MKSASERSKKPMSEKNQTNATGALPSSITVPHSTTQPPAVASDANVSTFSLVSVGPYEDFAVSIALYVCSFSQLTLCYVFSMDFLNACTDLFSHWFCYLITW